MGFVGASGFVARPQVDQLQMCLYVSWTSKEVCVGFEPIRDRFHDQTSHIRRKMNVSAHRLRVFCEKGGEILHVGLKRVYIVRSRRDGNATFATTVTNRLCSTALWCCRLVGFLIPLCSNVALVVLIRGTG